MLVWTDIETTGLDPRKDSILELAAIVTDDQLNEVARYQRVVYYPHAARIVELIDEGRPYARRQTGSPAVSGVADFFPDIHPTVLEMHDKNGLWRDCVTGVALDTLDREFAAFIVKYAHEVSTDGKRVLPQLAGSTISLDRGFLQAHLPRVSTEGKDAVLHYRDVDVSTFNEAGRRFWPEIYAARPNNKDKAHRGMSDIEESIRVFRHYLANLYAYRGTDSTGVIRLKPPENPAERLFHEDAVQEQRL